MCYLEPAAAAIVTTFVWRRKKTPQVFWLMLMFYGGSLFGVIDHLWRGELFLVSKNWAGDAVLGVVITTAITLTWLGILFVAKTNHSFRASLRTAE